MLDKIVLAGGSGYLGQVVADYYKDKAKEIVILSRKEASANSGGQKWIFWDAETPGNWGKELEGADLMVNFCGKNVNCRYTEQNKGEILRSRLVPTMLLGNSIKELATPPKVWINLASATIYRHAEDRPQDEDTGDIGAGFSVDVCKSWEECFRRIGTPATKKIIFRAGIVLGRKDGAFPRLKNLVKFGLGGHQGTGRQYVSWIHEQDFARAIEWAFEAGQDGAIYNVTAPEAVQNRAMMALIRKTYGIPFGLPSPQWLLEPGARLIGTETELILKSRWVYPGKLLKEGFTFQFPDAAAAIGEIMSSRT
jgi:uncharacterized protein (TIGR01777 family)